MLKPAPELVAAGRVAYSIHQTIEREIKPGLNLLEIEAKIAKLIKTTGMNPAFLGYKNYPATSCLSVNSTVVHGIPYDYSLRNGDVISVDLGVESGGWIVDTAVTHAVGKVSSEIQELLDVTERSLINSFAIARAGNTVGDIGAVIQDTVESAGLFVIRQLTGHGTGRQLQMPPSIPNHGHKGKGTVLKEGMILAIEPITAIEPVDIDVAKDDWSIIATPDVVCAHFEHTIFITSGAPIILTGSENLSKIDQDVE